MGGPWGTVVDTKNSDRPRRALCHLRGDTGRISAPNANQALVLQTLSMSLVLNPAAPCYWGGDFNGTPCIELDRSRPPMRGAQSVVLAHQLLLWATHNQLHEAWRNLYSTDRVYSFYSSQHGLHTRIDLVYCNPEALLKATSAEYHVRALSNHSLLQVGIQWSGSPPSIPTWIVPVTALHDTAYRESLRGHIESDYKLNVDTASDTGIEWDPLKVVLRSHAIKISYGTALLLCRELRDLELELKHYEQLLPTAPGVVTSLP
ncbi:hypothetical protein NDU88_001899 [Pleurodeles waltl]|uniref:Endonuclease/exonuclease/phosphatase domain-containing protein n=1 Tax=Pleurodeles waltl TaxID=8319 RepID=A0AAV7TJ54_PLEWA|nr:hypothetical protein NDU88_001899 [Pleurodeles waltl]